MAHRHGGVGALVDVHVAHAVQVLDDRHARLARDALDEALAAARHDRVDVLLHRDELAHGRAIGRGHELHRRLGQPRGLEPQREARGDRLVGGERFAPAAQDARVAGLQAQPAASAVTLGRDS